MTFGLRRHPWGEKKKKGSAEMETIPLPQHWPTWVQFVVGLGIASLILGVIR